MEKRKELISSTSTNNLAKSTSDFLFKVEQTYNLSKVKTMQEAIESKAPSLAQITKHHDKEFSKDVLETVVVRMLSLINVGKGFSSREQIRMTIDLIYEDYYYLKLSDIKIILSNGIKGLYGDLYDRMDATVLLSWFFKYNDERMSYSSSRSEAKHSSFRGNEGIRGQENYINEIAERMQKKEFINKQKQKK